MREFGDDVLVAVHHATRVEVLLRPVEPEGAAGFRREVPVDGFADLVVELGFGFGGGHDGRGLRAGTLKREAKNESKIPSFPRLDNEGRQCFILQRSASLVSTSSP
jgi:hypothetical protein